MAFTKILPAGISTTGLVTVDSLSVGDVTLTGDTDNLIINTDTVTVRPTLDLNFARDKRLDSKITFTRDSVGTYVDANGLIQTAVNNIPRFDHDPITGESLGLLIEESRTNLVTYSEDFSNGQWVENGASESLASSVTAPDGTTGSVYELIETSATSGHLMYDSVSVSSSTTYTWSVWMKANTRTYGMMTEGNTQTATAWFNLSTGTAISTSGTGSPSATAQKYPNGWVRCTMTFTTGASQTSANIQFGPHDDGSGFSYAGDGTSGIYVWGAQGEAGAFATSYIPTSGSTVTRAQDAPVIKATNFTDVFDTDFKKFSLFVDYDNSKTDDGSYYEIINFWGESIGYTDRIQVFKDTDSPYHTEVRAIGNNDNIFTGSAVTGSSKAAVQKFATSWSVPDYSNTSSRRWAFCFSGETPIDVVPDNTGTSVPAITRLGFGINPTRHEIATVGVSGGLIHFKRVVVYNKALSDAQLQNLTK